MKNYREINKEQHQLGSAYRKSSPDTMNAFIALHKAVMKEGEALELKYREMIALGIGIASRCDGCIAAHVAGAVKAGASRAELIATVDVAVLMGGGPSIIYGTQAHAAIEELLS
ncbi:carboxymuconolactone decarboxylase family protein [Aeromonas allosaccharophila]|uniref:carboxymuconolactone decarboxylase family protein n=1 Tax=Aeromonas TaxID=642 RepID=UPI0013C917B7|nr:MULTISPECIES: carboxymuconolactone decarboxylase family protein [Aeromonas]MCX0433199.1 carboxymuconolactone decarboxylase family protein [Aeromonas veronii]WDO01065.1 carboxymuconolactone decarboxylase family protein [Aeromonas allosaccharophila]